MDAKQIYLWYCKEKGVLSHVMNMYRAKNPLDWDRLFIQSIPMSFDTYFRHKYNLWGFRGLFCRMFEETYSPWYEQYANNPSYIKAKRNWEYFVTHNVKLDTKFNESDIIEYETWSQTKKGRFSYFDDSSNIIRLIDCDTNGIVNIRVSSIKSVNGEPFSLNYHIEKKGKCYGIDKR